MNNWTIIKGATDEASAHTVDNYPYGGYRTQCRWWVETGTKGPGKGHQRVAQQTMNPKNQRWNKAHYGIYAPMIVLYLDNATGHCHNHAVRIYSMFDLSKYIATGLSLQHDEAQAARFRAICRAVRRLSPESSKQFDIALSIARAEEMDVDRLIELHKCTSGDSYTFYTSDAAAVLDMVRTELLTGARIPTGEPAQAEPAAV